MKDKKFIALSSFFFLLFIAAIATIALQKPTSQILRAKSANPSPLKSFVIVFPQIAVAGDESSNNKPTQVKVSVYVRDESGSTMPGRSIKLNTTPKVTIKPSDTVTTDESIGMAQFFVSSSQKGTITIQATDLASNITVANPPNLSVEFTQ